MTLKEPAATTLDPAIRGTIAPRLLTDLLDGTVAAHADWMAIDFYGRRWSYARIGALVEHAARGFQDLGVRHGMRVALCLPNTPYFVIAYFAALRIGAIVVPVNPLYVERELRHLIDDAGPVVAVVCDLAAIHDKFAAAAENSTIRHIVVCPMGDILPRPMAWGLKLFRRKDLARIPEDNGRHLTWQRLIDNSHPPEPVGVVPDDVAVLQYTGGTTGVPKAAMLTHANLTANSAQMVLHLGKVPETQARTMGVLPLFHVFALTNVLNNGIEVGALLILLPRFEMPSFLKAIARTRPTRIFAVPTIYNAVSLLPDAKVPDLSFCETCISGGAPLPLEVRHAFEQRTRCRVVEGYGLTEASPVVACNPLDGVVKDNSAGPAFPATVLEIRDLEPPHRVQPTGQRGEVCVRGPQVMKGYWNQPQATEDAFIDGALRTGDVGYLDEDGYLFLVDRIKDVILCGGYNVYPRAIEDALYEHPAVAEAIAIGVPDPYRGQTPKAFVTLVAGQTTTPEELIAFLADKLNKIEIPHQIEIRDTLPKTLIGKLSRKELVAEEAAGA